MFKEILITSSIYFMNILFLIHYLNAVKYKAVNFNVILGFVEI